jgi:hypothetical protein
MCPQDLPTPCFLPSEEGEKRRGFSCVKNAIPTGGRGKADRRRRAIELTLIEVDGMVRRKRWRGVIPCVRKDLCDFFVVKRAGAEQNTVPQSVGSIY